MLIAFTLAFTTGVLATELGDAIKQAKAAQKEAASLGFEWRDTGKIIKNAEVAAKEGNDKKAIKLAKLIKSVPLESRLLLQKTPDLASSFHTLIAQIN